MGPITVDGSSETVEDNQISGQATITLGFPVVGSIIATGDSNLISGNHVYEIGIQGNRNIISGNYVFFNTSIGAGTAGIELSNADYNLICNNTEGGNNVGIAVGYGGLFVPDFGEGSYNLFAGNTIEGAALWGISMSSGSYNVFYGNLVTGSGGAGHDGYGLTLGGNGIAATNNLFFDNSFVNNSKNFATNWLISGTNFFDNGSIGNYWDDYSIKFPNATAANAHVETMPYPVYGNVTDNYPLVYLPIVSTEVPTLPNPWSQLNSLIPQSTSTSSVPEFSWLAIIALLLSLLAAAVVFKHRKTANLGK